MTANTNINPTNIQNTFSNFSITDFPTSPRKITNTSINTNTISNIFNTHELTSRENPDIITEEEMNKMFNFVKKEESDKNKFGPRIGFNGYDVNKSFDSFEINLEFGSNEEIFEINLSKDAEENIYDDCESDSDNDKKESISKPKNIKENPNSNHDEHYSIKIDNSKNEFRAGSIYTRNLYTDNNHNHSNNNMITKDIYEKKAICGCFSKNKKKKFKNIHNSSTYSTGNVTYTKRSSNLSFKSLKLNDSLNKLRKKKSVGSNVETNPSGANDKKEKISCNCLIM